MNRQSRHAEPALRLNRNYLVSDFNQLASTLAPGIQSHITTNAVLTPAQVAGALPSEQQQLRTRAQDSALLQTASQQAYSNAKCAICLYPAIDQCHPDGERPEGDLELQARIAAEHGMLQNESTKLKLLYQAAQAQEWARRQSASEAGGGKRRIVAHARTVAAALRSLINGFRPGAQSGRFCLGSLSRS